jgi:hypothetical protein
MERRTIEKLTELERDHGEEISMMGKSKDLLRIHRFLLFRGESLSEFGIDHMRVDGVGN